jgi:hypothetical protein
LDENPSGDKADGKWIAVTGRGAGILLGRSRFNQMGWDKCGIRVEISEFF